jgi:hypothetical protein
MLPSSAMPHAGHHLPRTANSSVPTETRLAVSHAAPDMAWVKLCSPCRLKISAEDASTIVARTTTGSVFGMANRISSTVASAIRMSA